MNIVDQRDRVWDRSPDADPRYEPHPKKAIERVGEHRQKRERTKVQTTDDDRAFAAEFIADISEYDAAQHNADKEAERYEAEIAAAKTKGHSVVRASRDKLNGELGEKRKDLDAQLAQKTAETEKRVQGLLQRAFGEMDAMTTGAVIDIVKALAGIEVSDSEVQAALRQRSKE